VSAHRGRDVVFVGVVLLVLAVLALAFVTPVTSSAADGWVSRAIPEARGDVQVRADGTRHAVRYKGWSTTDYSRFRTYAYDDRTAQPAVQHGAPPPGVAGDAARGRALFLSRSLGPCTGCHLVPGDDVWPAGNVGPDLSQIGDRGLSSAHLYAVIFDPRHLLPRSIMPPWGTSGAMTPAQIVDVVAYLQTLRGPRPAEKDTERDPVTRSRPPGFGDNLDPTNNPALLLAEDRKSTRLNSSHQI